MKNKRVIIEFEVDQELEFEELCNPVFEAVKNAMMSLDTVLNRIGTGKPSVAGIVTIRFNNFDGVNRTSVNGGALKMYKSYRKTVFDGSITI